MYKFFLFFFFFNAFILIILIMMQENKNSSIKSSFLQSSQKSLFSSSSLDTFLVKLISVLAFLFFFSSLILSNLNSKKINKEKNWKNLEKSITNKK
ncbi:preprotein translocase subunit SecG [bacterium endosymbiont of Pedicinus badii]|uniref:preprotein translocase subunit SecG n=1 Tax=bacterium endosymbiont of Pedicinus badii TaxID=1719126 RepID=UPI0009BA4392|nr:preprotein translocase subunit SecG [bacterium endosymbiont of Pedicinus badii]OQM34190.1 hypothetical protein AOQ89_02545 [bacterium endosymbiont of Pedicinus badii]